MEGKYFFSRVACIPSISSRWKFGTTGVLDTVLPQSYAKLVVLCICVFVVAFAFSWGPLAWLIPSEISPLEVRSAAQSVTVSMNMLFTFAVAQVFLKMLCWMKFGLLQSLCS